MDWISAATGATPALLALLAQVAPGNPTDCVPILWVGAITAPLVGATVHQYRERKATGERLEKILDEDRRWYRERGLPDDSRASEVVRDIVRGS